MKREKNRELYLLIWRVVALCASILALFCVIGFAILALFFPKPYAAVLKSVGLNQIALGVYEDIYKNSQDVNDGYVYLTESIYAKSNKNIINAFEMVIKDGDFVNLLLRVDLRNQNKFGFTVSQATLCNERDYLMGNYVYSIAQSKGFDTAFEVSKSDFDNIIQNLNSINNDKSFVFFDLAHIMNSEDAKLFDLEIQLKFLHFASICENLAKGFLSLDNFSLTDYAESLECVIRSIEVYVMLIHISENGNLLVLNNSDIENRLNDANNLFNDIVRKVQVFK